MRVEVRRVERPRLPRYFPPGYFVDWRLWTAIAANVFGLGWCAYFARMNADAGQIGFMGFQCGLLALNVMSAANAVRMMWRHSREWRTVDRPQLEAVIADAEKQMAQMQQEFAEFMEKRGGGPGERN